MCCVMSSPCCVGSTNCRGVGLSWRAEWDKPGAVLRASHQAKSGLGAKHKELVFCAFSKTRVAHSTDVGLGLAFWSQGLLGWLAPYWDPCYSERNSLGRSVKALKTGW